MLLGVAERRLGIADHLAGLIVVYRARFFGHKVGVKRRP
jgi:hypothetical protein